MSSYSFQLEHLIEELGGCGLMQILLCIVIHSSSIISHWSMLGMSFIGYDPGFTCQTLDVKYTSLPSIDLSNISSYRLCTVGHDARCTSYIFHPGLNTAVSEWGLVCENRWIVAFITTIQMVGIVVGSTIAGQMADSTGRKPTLITAVFTLFLFNFAGYFAQTWKAYSAIRFFIGIGIGLYYTVQFPQMIEFVPPSWQPFVVCIPSEPFIIMLYALASWWLYDWKRIHLLKTFIGLFFLIILCFVPESFRWLISKQKFKRADKSISFVANVNRVNKPDLKKLFDTAEKETNAAPNSSLYTVIKLWSSKDLRNVTLSLSVLWFAECTTWFCMALGLESISVNIYLSIFLINLVDIPALSATGPLVNRFGRRKYCFVTFGVCSILSCVSGVLQHFDKPLQNFAFLNVATLVFSLLAKMTVTAADTALIVYTTELYPTEVRTTGYGVQVTAGRLGSTAAPLLIHLDGLYPGSMYFTCGVLMLLSTGSILRLKETKGVTLQDSVTVKIGENDR